MWVFIVSLVVILITVLIQFANTKNDLAATQRKLAGLQTSFHDDLHKQLDRFRNDDLKTAKDQALQFAQLEFDHWKADYTCTERADAVKKSRAVNRGLVSEQLAPHLAGFAYNPKDCRFLGSPIDYVVFNGLDSGLLKEIVLIDVKTGDAKLSARQIQIKNIVGEKRIRFEAFRPEIQ
jgi:predicted Holliday junction resolvase-like endonuclease